MKITYNGPHDAVELAETGQVVQRGTSIEVSDELGLRLAEQVSFDTAPKAVLAMVGKDAELAQRMLNAELNGARRAEVVRPLEKLLKIDEPTQLDPAPEPPAASKATTTTTVEQEG